MGKIAKFFITNHKFTIVLSFFMAIYGVMGLQKMTAESYPSVSFATAYVTTVYDGASSEDVEIKVTKPIEDEIRTVSGVKDVRSTSQAGLSTIVIRVDMDNVDDVDKVMSDLQKAVDRVNDLPVDIKDPPYFQEIKSEEFPVYQIAVTGSNENRARDILADTLKEDIEDLKSVKGVTLDGFAKRRFEIILDKELLREKHIGIQEILSKLRSRNVNIPGGNIKSKDNQKLVRIEGKVEDIEDLGNVLIRSRFGGETIYLKDVATVVDGKEEIKVHTTYNGEQATLMTIAKKAGADTIEMVDKIIKKVEAFKKTHPGYEFHVYNDEQIKVKNKLEVLSSNAISGLALVIIFLFIFLPGRIGLLASMSLPLAVMGTIGLMPAFGMTLNAITILALVIALGMLVDNSVVISENYTRLLGEGYKPLDAAVTSVKNLWLPITGTAMTTIAAFLPMLVTKGIMGEFIKWIPVIVTISLLLSLLESFFFLPMRLVNYGGKTKDLAKAESENSKDNKDWFHKFENKFENFMDFAVRRRYFVMVIFSGIIIGSIALMAFGNKFVLFPADQTEIYIARFQTERGTPVEKTRESLKELSQAIKETLDKDAKHLVGFSGRSKVQLTDPKAEDGNNVGIVFIYVSDYAKYNLAHTVVLEKLRTIKVPSIKQLTFEAQINGPPVGDAIEGTFRSNSSEDLTNIINEIMAELKNVDGIMDLKIDDVYGDQEVYLDIDYAKADQLGLDVNHIGQNIRAAVAGNLASTVTLDNKDVDLEVRYSKDQRSQVEDLLKIKVADNSGNLVPIANVAKIRVENGTPNIKRYDFKKSKTLLGNVDENKITSAIANAHLAKIYDKVKSKYPGVSLKFGGVAESTNESMESLASAGILASIGIFAILVFLFRSFLRPVIIMMTIPLGLLGLSIAFATPVLSGYPDRARAISFLALIGIIGLAGIIVNSGIVLISFIDELREKGELDLHQILVKASGMRLRAVLVTSLTTISGLIPTAYGIGGTDAMLVPMTMGMAWGLTSGTILTLIFIPCAYAILEDLFTLVDRIKSKLSKGDSDAGKHSEESLVLNEVGNE
ncbi:efflux RND transporter permease subunit [Bacteriovorax sp. DB6_IX]|uniref:efflux RND transporter permease subunit n=1 Tax=Bacteriovorax sp. DB6_IX TaxID=1353530 RepID=UPI00038A4A98|nr:efflux RND transporter permease subunit [Bacteriovorax sp. DB6_IX]EQC51981.1 export membrane protein [Bacteriovorax sp. DB6_IX]